MNTMKRITGIILGMMIISSLAASVMMVTSKQSSFATSSDAQNFMNMTEEQRVQAAKNMTQEEKQVVMNEFSKQNSTEIIPIP